jgi:hypothetical protein
MWPSCAIMGEDPRIFYAHTLRHLLVEHVHFLFLGPSEWIFFFARMWKRTLWQARRYAGCPRGRHGCSWDAIWVNKCARKKCALFKHPCGSNDFSVVKACTPVHMRVPKCRKSASLKISEGLCLTNLATGNLDLDPNRPENELYTLETRFHFEVRFSSERSS